ncbi:MAG: hypothetical protein JWR27_1900 [Aeromicrobium sp.]|jgi:hypothetical protein|nr:hypothetical protein [Aeromicrobium sp.]
MTWVMLLGFTATAVSVASSVPQTYRMIRFKRDPRALLGLSVMTPLIVAVNEVMVFIYGWSLGAIPLWLPQCFAVPFHVFVVLFILRSRVAYRRSRGAVVIVDDRVRVHVRS